MHGREGRRATLIIYFNLALIRDCGSREADFVVSGAEQREWQATKRRPGEQLPGQVLRGCAGRAGEFYNRPASRSIATPRPRRRPTIRNRGSPHVRGDLTQPAAFRPRLGTPAHGRYRRRAPAGSRLKRAYGVLCGVGPTRGVGYVVPDLASPLVHRRHSGHRFSASTILHRSSNPMPSSYRWRWNGIDGSLRMIASPMFGGSVLRAEG